MFQIKLSESTAARRRIPVLLVDSTDGFTPKTGQTAPTITISKNGATAVSGAGTFTEVANGVYYYEFTVGEADTLGWIALNVQKATCRQYNAIIQVMAYDYAVGTNLGLSNLNDTITSRMATFTYTAPPTAQNVWEYATRTLTSGSSPSATTIADAVLNRKLDSTGDGTDTLNERTVRSALRAMRNKVSVASGVMTVTKEDDTATAWTATLSNTANVTVDPT
tara:strand:- start:324 stop:989 length:666 start_codon:yes stop_codon:yes gene_type:complete